MAAALLAGSAAASGDAVVEEAARLVLTHHMTPIEAAALPVGDRDAFLEALLMIDPHASWSPPDEVADPAAGVGVKLLREGGALVAVVLPGGPLDALGVSGAQRLQAVDGAPVDASRFEAAVKALAGSASTPASLTLTSLENGWTETVVAVRAAYPRRSAFRADVGDAAILRIVDFVPGETAAAAEAALAAPPRPGDAPLIVDLRYATGGDLAEAVDVAALFVPPGATLTGRVDRDGVATGYRAAATAGPRHEGPIAVLVGPATASAAEVLLKALQARADARSFGARSVGKCLAQRAHALADGSVLRFSTHRLLGPDGEPCDTVGVAPDVAVEPVLTHATHELARRIGLRWRTGRWDAPAAPAPPPLTRWPPRLKD
jgi:carboxyl-terminal processing protease